MNPVVERDERRMREALEEVLRIFEEFKPHLIAHPSKHIALACAAKMAEAARAALSDTEGKE